jgi:arylsulfatase A-like enzyme
MNILIPGLLIGFLMAGVFGLKSILNTYGDSRLFVYYLIVFIPAFGVLSFILHLYGKRKKITPTIFNNVSLMCVALISFLLLYFTYYTIKYVFNSGPLLSSKFLIFILTAIPSFLFFLWISNLRKKVYKYLIIVLTTFSIASWVLISLNLELGFRKKDNVNQEDPNILLLTIESLRYDYLGCNGNKEIKTPNIDALAENGIVFDNYFVQSSYTTASLATLLTGSYPFRHGSRRFGQKPSPKYRPFIERLSQKGYYVELDAGFFSELFPHYSHYNHSIVFNKSLSFYDNVYNGLAFFQDVINENLGNYMPFLFGQYCFGNITSMKTTSKLLQRLRVNRYKKWFFWVHFSENCHWPYSAPSNYLKMYSKNNTSIKTSYSKGDLDFYYKNSHYLTDNVKKSIATIYGAEVSCIDNQIGMIVNIIKKLKLLEKTVIIISADHGELLGEYNYFGHGKFVKDTLIHVPLIIYLPGYSGSRKRIRDLVEEVDIAPTVLDICRVDSTQKFDGRSFLNLLNAKGWQKNAVYSGVFSEGNPFRCCYRTKEYKIVWDAKKDDFALYNIVIDTEERMNLANRYPAITKKLKQELLVLTGYKSLYDLKPKIDDRESEDMKNVMRALGYIK